MDTARSLLRIHAHAWFVCGMCFLIFLSFVYLKVLQIYFELEVDHPAIMSTSERWLNAWKEVPGRRLDDPSLWAMVAAAAAAWLLTRGATHASCHSPMPAFIWTRSLKCWVWLVGMVALSSASYLGVAFLKNEVFWYADKPEHAKYLHTPIPFIQTIEGVLNLAAILAACSLVPIVRSLVKRVRVPTNSDEEVPSEKNQELFKARAGSRLWQSGHSP